MKPKILDIGCGKRKTTHPDVKVTGLDKYNLPGIDIVCDIEKTPLPLENESFDIIIANHILEHIDNFFPLMEELHRILKPNGIIKIRVPCWQSHDAFSSPDHKRFFGLRSFNFFLSDCSENYYTKARFEIIKKEACFINYRSRWKFLNHIINPIINSWQGFFQKFAILPAEEIYFELRKEMIE